MRQVPKLLLPVLAASAIALAIAACGSSSPKPLTRAQLTAKTDAICRRVSGKLASVGTLNGAAQIARVTSRLSAFEQGVLAQLGALVPPAALESDWKRFVDGAQSLAEATVKLGEDAAAKRPNEIGPLLASAEATQRRMRALARRDGFTACTKVVP